LPITAQTPSVKVLVLAWAAEVFGAQAGVGEPGEEAAS
jgi:hypothetical protein